MAISAPGIGSNLDVNGIVSQLMALERRPLALLDSREAGLQARISAYGSLKGAVSSFQSAIQGLKAPAKFQAYTARAADTAILAATADVSAAAGTYSVTVGQLARAHVVKAGGVASDTTASSTGTLTLRVGSGAVTTVTINASNNTLRGVRDAINGAQAGVTATIVNDGSATPYRLVLTATATGAANTIQVTNGLSAGELKDAFDNLAQVQGSQDASITVNGIAVTSASNSVTGVVAGVTLDLLKEGATTLAVTRDTQQAQAAVQSFVAAYNSMNTTIRDLTSYDPDTKKAGALLGDSAANQIQARMRATLSANLTGLGGSTTRLSQVGVAFQADGSLALDSAKLAKALAADPDGVAGLFAAQGRSSSALVAYVGASSATRPGNYDVDITSAATQGGATATSAPAVSTVIDGTNDTFAAVIDGTSSGVLTLAHGTYSAAQLATLVQGALSGSAALNAAGIGVTVTLDAGSLRIASERYGTGSTVASVSGTAAVVLGYAGTETGAGTNVAGTFSLNGVTATGTGAGQLLSGPAGSAAEGLAIQYSGTAVQLLAGTDAVVSFSEGYASRLYQVAQDFLESDGPLDSRTDGLHASIEDIDARREALNVRLAAVENRLRAQFTALDTLIGRLSATSTFLQQQLANLPRLNSRE